MTFSLSLLSNKRAQMNIHRFYDNGLAHASYAVVSHGAVALIDPARNPQPYIDFAAQLGATIVAVIETHPHADFVSSHAELHRLTGATLYVHPLVGASYPHQPFGDGDRITVGNLTLQALHTPGHSPDSICVLVNDAQGKPHAVFTGDTLFIGDVGRPDLRQNVGNVTAKAEALARQLYQSLRQKLMILPADVVIYPAHGPGSLCGKQMSAELESTIGQQIKENYALQPMDEDEFVALVTDRLPYVPPYFGYDVNVNRQGATDYADSLNAIPEIGSRAAFRDDVTIVDVRPQDQFRSGHHFGAINIPDGLRFETWLGTVIRPGEPFYLIAGDYARLQTAIEKAAKIGYEAFIAGKSTDAAGPQQSALFDEKHFLEHPEAYTIVDLRSRYEAADQPIFTQALNIPLPELRDRITEIPADKPIAIHCAGGYRSAIGASIVAAGLPNIQVVDIGTKIMEFTPAD